MQQLFEKFISPRIDPSWFPILHDAFSTLPQPYVNNLANSDDWLPGKQQLLNAFSIPLSNVTTILLGESPYPRPTSANGYAFWDNAVTTLWSDSGLSKAVNRATSLRNWLKLLLLIRGDLSATDLSQSAIATIDKTPLVATLDNLFDNLLKKGFLLLNACLVLSTMPKAREAKIWHPFMTHVLKTIAAKQRNCNLLLFGNIAEKLIDETLRSNFHCLIAEHPYNISFIHNPSVQAFFKPLHCLDKES